MSTSNEAARGDLYKQIIDDVVLLSKLVKLQAEAATPSVEWMEYHNEKIAWLDSFADQLKHNIRVTKGK